MRVAALGCVALIALWPVAATAQDGASLPDLGGLATPGGLVLAAYLLGQRGLQVTVSLAEADRGLLRELLEAVKRLGEWDGKERRTRRKEADDAA